MKRIAEIWNMFFPYRNHLENEVAYLRDQVAQKQRRIDEMREWQHEFLSRAFERRNHKPPERVDVKPRGWEQYRRANGRIPVKSDEGSEDSASGVGVEAHATANANVGGQGN